MKQAFLCYPKDQLLKERLREREWQLKEYHACRRERIDIMAGMVKELTGKVPSPKLSARIKLVLKEHFEQHWDVLGKHLMALAGSFTASASLPTSVKDDVTILLHKKGAKDQLENYRPTILLNFRYKVLARVLASRIKKVLHKGVVRIHTREAGLLPHTHPPQRQLQQWETREEGGYPVNEQTVMKIVAVGAARGTPRTPFFEGCSPSPLAPSYASAAAVDILGAEDIAAASALSGKCRSSKSKGGKSGGGGSGGGGGGGSGGGGGGGGGGSGGSGGGSGGFGDGGGGSGGVGGGGGGGRGSGGSGSGGGQGGAVQRGGSGGGQRQQQQQRRGETPTPQQLREWFPQRGASGGSVHYPYSKLLRSEVDIFALDYDAIIAAMYALSVSAEGDYYLCVPPDPGIEAAALGASDSALPGTARAEALHTFTFDSGASRCFFRDSAGAGGNGAGDPGAEVAGAGGARASDPGAGGTVQRCPFVVPPPPSSLAPPESVLCQVLSLSSSIGLPPSLLSPPPHQSKPQSQLESPMPAPSPYAEQADSFTELREPESRPASPLRAVRTGRRVPRPRPPPFSSTHIMALRPSSVPLRVPLPSPPSSSLPHVPDPESDLARAASLTVPRLLATVVTDPSFESTAASALVAELVDFAAT
ncbi:unnamed protein product [Closterium sp. NIES-54]